MKLQVICCLATVAISFTGAFKLNNATGDLDVLSHQSRVEDLGMDGCNYVNQVRAQSGRSTLFYSGSLTDIGARHSGWMARHAVLEHQRLDGVGVWIGEEWLAATGENIAMSAPRSNDVAWDAHQQWYNSPEHFLNMIDGLHTHCGVGFAYDRQGRWWATEVFGRNRFIGHEFGVGASVRRGVPAAAMPASPAPEFITRPERLRSGDRWRDSGERQDEKLERWRLAELLSRFAYRGVWHTGRNASCKGKCADD